MDERDDIAVRPRSWVFIDQSDAARLETVELRLQIIDPVGGVMELRRRVAAVACERRVVREWSQELDDRIARVQTDGLDALVGDGLAIDDAKAERLRIEAQRRLEVGDDDRNVIERHATA